MILFTTTDSSKPALFMINRLGASSAFLRISAPIDSSPCMPLVLIASIARISATPPPGTIPSFIAAFVAQIASSTLSLFSLNSISELAPTLTRLL